MAIVDDAVNPSVSGVCKPSRSPISAYSASRRSMASEAHKLSKLVTLVYKSAS
jgi:hypothetical protein